MKTVEAIKSRKQINQMKAYLKLHSLRDHSLFLLGVNTGIKLQELIHLRVSDITGSGQEIVEFLSLPHYCNTPIYLNASIRSALKKYIHEDSLVQTDYLFKSRKTGEPITRQQAYRILNAAAKEAGIEEPVGMTTLRKTFGYHAYTKGIAISLIQKRLQHASPSETLQFIGVERGIENIKLNVDL